MNINKTELEKLITKEKDKMKLNYKQRINNISLHYNVDFDIEYYPNEIIKEITFNNLNYKNIFSNMVISYDNDNNYFNYLNYDYNDSRIVKKINHKKIVSYLEKEYKLKFIVAELKRANQEYIYIIKEIDNKFLNTSKKGDDE